MSETAPRVPRPACQPYPRPKTMRPERRHRLHHTLAVHNQQHRHPPSSRPILDDILSHHPASRTSPQSGPVITTTRNLSVSKDLSRIHRTEGNDRSTGSAKPRVMTSLKCNVLETHTKKQPKTVQNTTKKRGHERRFCTSTTYQHRPCVR